MRTSVFKLKSFLPKFLFLTEMAIFLTGDKGKAAESFEVAATRLWHIACWTGMKIQLKILRTQIRRRKI